MRRILATLIFIINVSLHLGAQSAANNAAGTGPGCSGGCGVKNWFELNTYSVGGDVSAPVLVHAVDPILSEEARHAHYEPDCLLQVVVEANGEISRALVKRAVGMGLDEQAIKAVKQYRYKPAVFHGNAVPVHILVTVRFRDQSAP